MQTLNLDYVNPLLNAGAPSMTDSGTEPSPKVTYVVVHSEICLAHEYCVSVCPEVFNVTSGVVALNEGAERLYESKGMEILEAERLCPVDAIKVQTDPPRPSAAFVSPAVVRGGPNDGPKDRRSLADRLREARGEQVAPSKAAFWGMLNEAIKRVLENLTCRKL
jgi:ferredoxin